MSLEVRMKKIILLTALAACSHGETSSVPVPVQAKESVADQMKEENDFFDQYFEIKDPDTILNYKNGKMDLWTLTQKISQDFGFKILSDPKLVGTIQLSNFINTTRRDVFKLFLSSLYENSWTLQKLTSYYKIIRLADSRETNIPTLDLNSPIPDAEFMVTSVFQVKNVDSDDVIRNIRTLTNRESRVFSLESNKIIIVDTASNLRRLRKIISKVDKFYDVNPDIINEKLTRRNHNREIEKLEIQNKSPDKTALNTGPNKDKENLKKKVSKSNLFFKF